MIQKPLNLDLFKINLNNFKCQMAKSQERGDF